MFSQIIDMIKQYERIAIHRHTRPDGDAIGSQTGLKTWIRDNFPEKTVVAVGDAPGNYSFIPGSAPDTVPDEFFDGALSVILDCGARHLIADDRYTRAAATVRIDHHLFAETIADVEVIDTSYESAAGMVAELARESGLRLSPEAARALYTGMTTDSGRFRYDSTTPRTLRLAAYLLESGFSLEDVYRDLYADTIENRLTRAAFTQKIRFTERGVAYIYTTGEELAASGLDTFTVSRGMVGTMADLAGVDIWVNFTETEAGVLAELRSSRYNINPIAVRHGGGGHKKASGATLKGRAEAEAMLAELDQLTEEKG